jgi:hypothetical protein
MIQKNAFDIRLRRPVGPGTCSACRRSPLRVMCGRRLIDKSFFDVDAALVGCGHVSGLFVRRGWPLALMLCADRVPIVRMHLKVR